MSDDNNTKTKVKVLPTVDKTKTEKYSKQEPKEKRDSD